MCRWFLTMVGYACIIFLVFNHVNLHVLHLKQKTGVYQDCLSAIYVCNWDITVSGQIYRWVWAAMNRMTFFLLVNCTTICPPPIYWQWYPYNIYISIYIYMCVCVCISLMAHQPISLLQLSRYWRVIHEDYWLLIRGIIVTHYSFYSKKELWEFFPATYTLYRKDSFLNHNMLVFNHWRIRQPATFCFTLYSEVWWRLYRKYMQYMSLHTQTCSCKSMK